MAELKNIRIAVSGIYDYAYSELPTLRLPFPHQDGAPEWAEKKDIYKVYRPASVLAAACGKFKLLPLTHHHPSVLVDSRNFRDLTIGYTGENPFVDYLDDKDEVGIRSNVLLYDDEAQGAYERGEKQLSPGYIATFEWQRGVSPHGEPYDIVMKEISDVNHLALLPAGRGGEDAVVLDKEPTRQTIFDIVRMTRDEQDANGNEHSASNGQFVSKGDGGADQGKNNSETEEDDDSGYPEKNYPEYKGTGQKAIDFLVKNKGGQVKGAFSRKDVGDIDVVWGEVTNAEKHQGYGIAHIIDKHGMDVVSEIGNIIKNGNAEIQANGIATIYYQDFKLGLSKGWYGKGDNHWILTAYQKNKETDKTFDAAGQYSKAALFEILMASHRWQNTKDGKSVFQPAVTGNPTDNITRSEKKRKTIFERVQGTIFDLYAP